MDSIYTEMDINRVYIILGLSCNFNCKYCYQQMKHYDIKDKRVSEQTISYIKRLIDMRPFSKEKPLKIMFWGGEPLMYFETIKDIVEKLEELPVVYGTVSNGSLVTQEIVDYFNAHKIGIAISNDGEETKNTRYNNILENKDKMQLIRQFESVSIDSVVSAYNCNYLATIDYAAERFGRVVPVCFEWLMCDKNTKQDLYNFDYDTYELYVKQLLFKIKVDIANGVLDSNCWNVISNIINNFNNPKEKDLFPHCGAVRHTLNIDLYGNIYACHPADKTGDTQSTYKDMLSLYNKKYNQAFSYCDCANCEYVLVCKAGCPLELPCEGKLAVCKAKRILFKNVQEFMESKEVIKID